MATKRSMKAEVNKTLEEKGNVKDVSIPKELAGLVMYGEEEFRFWVPEGFKKAYPKDKTKWPVFKIRNYNAGDEAAIMQAMLENNMTGKDDAIKFFMTDPRASRILVRRCLKGVKNLIDMNGKEVLLVLVNDEVPEDFLSRIPFKLLNEVQQNIMSGTMPSEEETTGLEF